ncbi:MAG: UDP-glucose 4-epimerase GalE [Candidatus Marinimicrobia bacterium]|nr:UDP-glucose 4-epimerase GalE [Candidatus Neomarinimicrobiota bacterium]
MNVLVIGGAGYIGSHVVWELCGTGHDVAVFDNLSTGNLINIDSRAEFIQGDILNSNNLNSLFSKKYDAVFHFAALKAAGESMTKPGKYATSNITGTINILNRMVEKNIKYFIFSSTAAVYGMPEYLPVDEMHPLNPINFYGYTKLEIENLLSWYSKLKGIRFGALRYFNAAGYDINGKIKGLEKNPANLLPIIMETALGLRDSMNIYGDDYNTPDGTGIRDYIHVNDLATAHVRALNYIVENKDNLTLNLATGVGYSVLDVIESLQQITGKELKYKIIDRRAGDPAELIAVSKLANEYLNWECKYSDIKTILQSMWDVYSQE